MIFRPCESVFCRTSFSIRLVPGTLQWVQIYGRNYLFSFTNDKKSNCHFYLHFVNNKVALMSLVVFVSFPSVVLGAAPSQVRR